MSIAGKKLLFISERAGFAGGIERFIFHTARLLREAGFDLTGQFRQPDRDREKFLAPFHRVVSPEETPEADFAVIHKIQDPSRLEKLLEVYGERLAVCVHDHAWYCPRSYRYTPFGRRNCTRPYSMIRCGLCAMATSPRRWQGGFRAEISQRFSGCKKQLELLRKVPHVAVLSGFMRQNLADNGIDPARITVIPPPVSIPETLCRRPENDPPRLLFTGQLIRGKGVDLLLRALPMVRRPFRLIIAGEGNQRTELEELACRLAVKDRVTFAGWVAEPEKLYAECDISVLPFFWQEPFGLVGPEGMARGLPAVAFRMGGVEEWLRDGETGLSVPPRDTAGLAAAIDKLLEDRVLREKLGAGARKFVCEHFSEGEFVRRFRSWMDAKGEKA
ncbi:MAG: glycosyltransferase family 4 protein [Lentisphaeria bacterium]|nr:glycosyltransferase family 4 protein [Lentisphaeria bacterium]